MSELVADDPDLAENPASNAAHPQLELLSGAHGQDPPISPDLMQTRLRAADASLPLAERLEAFEDIMDSEVGDTSLSRARNIEREVGLRQIYLKFEGGNPTGTQKDRIAFAQVMDAMRRGFDGLSAATCGNYGAAMALASWLAGLRCMISVPSGFHSRRVQEMEKLGATIIRPPGDYEAAVDHSRELARRLELYDANPGGENTALQMVAYGEIAVEIYDELRDAPAAVAVPVSNGTTLAGIHKGFVRLYRRGKTSRIPRMVAGSSHNKNPIIRGYLRNFEQCTDLPPEAIRETPVNEPLVNWHSIDGDAALASIRGSGGSAAHVSDRAMRALSRRLREQQGLAVLPAATAGLSALLEMHQKQGLGGDRYVAVLTGRKA